jgi:hypothetical protein
VKRLGCKIFVEDIFADSQSPRPRRLRSTARRFPAAAFSAGHQLRGRHPLLDP